MPIQTVVSYVDILNNTYGTKTICITNTDRLSPEEQEWLRENAEKTFARRIRVEPSPAYVRDIAIGTADTFDDAIANLLEVFDVRNIRIAIEIARNCRAFLGHVGEGERKLENDELKNRLTTVAAATASLSGLRNFPPPKFFRETMDRDRFDLSEDPTDEEGWRGTLTSLGYRVTDQFDHLLIDQIDRGYFSGDVIESHFREAATGITAGGQTKYSAAWREYHDSTGADTAGFVQRFFEGAMESVTVIEIHNMNASVRLLNYLGETEKAKRLADVYVERNKGKGPAFFDLDADPFMTTKEVDLTFAAAMEDGLSSEIASMNPVTVLEEVAKSDSIGNYQARRLGTLSVSELRDATFAIAESLRWSAIKACLAATRHNSDGTDRLQIVSTTKDMLKEMAAVSTINRVRIQRKFDLTFEDASGTPQG